MPSLSFLYAAVIGLAAALATIGMWAPRKLWMKLGALVAAAMSMPLAYAGLADLLGRPKPIPLEFAYRSVQEATVLGTQIREGVGIYLWLQIPGADEPRAYALPWHEALARQLHGAGREAERQGTELGMRSPFKSGWDEAEPRFYALPQPARPAKSTPGEGPLVLTHPGGQG